ncbi:MAG: hypothetical protein LBH14_04325 [Desulfobulbaceae bacterium]|jgi:hypothetical protein|nr:hypothetical protein [Desulfobulbaceae bacterium]
MRVVHRLASITVVLTLKQNRPLPVLIVLAVAFLGGALQQLELLVINSLIGPGQGITKEKDGLGRACPCYFPSGAPVITGKSRTRPNSCGVGT